MSSNQSAASRIQDSLGDLFKGNFVAGTPHVKFQLTSDKSALLSMEQVEETLIVEAGQITLLPSMPRSVIGIMNSRDRVFCVFDLAQLLNLPSKIITPRKYQIIVVQTIAETPIQFGLAVSSLQGITRLATEQIDSATDGVDQQIAPYLSGVVQTDETTIPVLGFVRIAQALETLL